MSQELFVDLGCGENPHPDADIGLDIRACEEVDIVADIRDLPFADETVTRLNASQVLEHFDGNDLFDIFAEATRVLEPGGTFTFDVPMGRSWAPDPTHKQKWRFKTVLYFLPEEEHDRYGYDHIPDYDPDTDFQLRVEDWSVTAWLEVHRLPFRAVSFVVKHLSHLINTDLWADAPFTAARLEVTLRKPDPDTEAERR